LETQQPEPFAVLKTPCSEVFPNPKIVDIVMQLEDIDKLVKTVFTKVS
jgi:hypothetical protein